MNELGGSRDEQIKMKAMKHGAFIRFLTAKDQPRWVRGLVAIGFVIAIIVPDFLPFVEEGLLALWLYTSWRNENK